MSNEDQERSTVVLNVPLQWTLILRGDLHSGGERCMHVC